MQIRGPAQASNETEPCGHTHSDPAQTGGGVMSPSQLGEQHRSPRGGGPPQEGGPRQKAWPGHSCGETDPTGQCQPEASQNGEVVTSFVHPATQQTNPGLSSHGFPVPASRGPGSGPWQKRWVGQYIEETKSGGKTHSPFTKKGEPVT